MASDRTQGGRSAEVTETLVSVPFDGGSDGVQRMRPMHGRTSGPTRRSTKGQWTPEEDDLLHKAVQRFKGRNWKRIAECFKDRTDVQCLHRWQKVLNPELVKGPWSKEEDDIIIELVNKYGAKKWSTIAQALPGRIGKQCRERWHNHLNPAINKEAWTQEEELVLIQAHQIYGNKWAELTKFLPGRTDNSIKNHWNSSVKKKLDSYLASGLLTKFQGLPHLPNPNQCMPSSLRTQQSSGESSVLKDVAETEEISECSQVSTAAGCSESEHDMAYAVSVQTQEFKLSEEEASQRMGQSSCMLSCSQQYYPLEEVPELSHELESSVDLSEQNIFSEFGVSESNNDHFSSHELPRMSSPEVAQEPPAFFETSAPCMERVDENHKTESGLLQDSMGFTAATSMGNMILGSDGQDHASKSKGDRCGVMFPESSTDGCFSIGNQIDCSNINLDGCVNSFICQSDIQGSEADRSLTSQSYYSLQSSDMMGASTSQPLSGVPPVVCNGESELIRGSECNEPKDGSTGNQESGFFTSSRDNFIHLNVSTCSSDGEMDKFYLGMERDQSGDDSKSVPVDIFSSLTSELTEMLPCMDESTTVHTENPDTGALYYEPPRFPSLEIPFVSCDLISSSGDLQQAYSPLGIRQLSMSSMNCSSPYSLWDSPARDGSPDLVLKSAAKSFLCTPSILKKRSRDLLSPLQEKKSDKRLERDTNQGMFCTSELAKDFSFLDVVFDDKVDRRRASLCSIEEVFLSPSDTQRKNFGAFIRDKENLDHASKAETGVTAPPEKVSEKGFDDTDPPEKTRQGCSDGCKVLQPSGVLVEQNVNNMRLFSPDRDRCQTNKTLNVGTKTPRNEKLRSGHSESLLGKQCLSVIVSPTFRGKRHGKNVVPLTQCATSSGLLEVASENGGDGVDIENLSMFGDTPNFKRSIESPSAWKSPWFMNSFLPGPRVDTDITIEDIGYFMSPGERSYDAIGLMKQFSEHTAAVVAEAEEILASDNPGVPSKERCSTDLNSAQNCNRISDEELPCGVLSEQRVLDFSGCATPEKQIEIGRSVGTIYGAGFSSSPSSYLIKGCR